MNQIQLHFTNTELPELAEVFFIRQGEGDGLLSVRGKTSTTPETNRTFQWTPAVKALSILLLSSKAKARLTSEIGVGELTGEKGSLASTLDYAISKQPAWITDIFGTYNGGNCYLRRLVSRTNSERKQPGPVCIKLIESQLNADSISVYKNQRELEVHESLDLLKSIIHESDSKTSQTNDNLKQEKIDINEPSESNRRVCSVSEYLNYQQSLGPLPSPFSDPLWHSGLRHIYKQELLEVLTTSDIFSKSGREKALRNLSGNSPLSKIIGKGKVIFDEIESAIGGLSRLGISNEFPWLQEHLLKKKPLTMAFACVHVGAIAIAKSLRNLKSFNVKVNSEYPHSTDLAEKVRSLPRNEAPDFFCVNLATAAWFMDQTNNNGYIPFMLMPMFSQRVQSPKKNKSKGTLQEGEFHFMSEIPTSAYLYFEEMSQNGLIQKRKTSVCETDLLEIPALLECGESDSRIISPFPLYKFYETYDVEYLDTTVQSRDLGYRSTIMFVKEELQSEPRLLKVLNLAIRNTWLELIEDNIFFEQALDLLISDRSYVKTISRMGGLRFLAKVNNSSTDIIDSWTKTSTIVKTKNK